MVTETFAKNAKDFAHFANFTAPPVSVESAANAFLEDTK
ncbi:hypothetical protein STL3553_c34320 [Salmonella enterica subsp. enterica serovar Typhimurium str. L-3553]|uniref:Uncharacterized protein n=1 Tax=Salmonella typhimurium (strain 14028s / SGSC 2262) TaxID=588858 RepID=A0A0F6B6V7_SALT1|nr:hypothetical protein STM14_3851 [Salmonella enterica subsp. enterica serovar Typhimurium str. 14028S]AIE07137.1 hypothetical protein DC51_3270 [Salmonella enterica subsp. enterica serovar Typhimurium]EFX50911.1 hypothetical protein SEE_01217 [Salmonella enterica subsp. enterica serovar Typhimurium str. TN061786]CAK4055968.1 hypothetical protein [Salmonella enterica subsp. enterica serovar Rissen]CEI44428.1 FIG01046654: hypothetical protein [Salmonella enterica subsp. enterica serovar Infanti